MIEPHFLLPVFKTSNTCLFIEFMFLFKMYLTKFNPFSIITNLTGIIPSSRCMTTLLGFPYWLKIFLCSIVSGFSNVSRSFFVRLIQFSELYPNNILSSIIFVAFNLCLPYDLSESVVFFYL